MTPATIIVLIVVILIAAALIFALGFWAAGAREDSYALDLLEAFVRMHESERIAPSDLAELLAESCELLEQRGVLERA